MRRLSSNLSASEVASSFDAHHFHGQGAKHHNAEDMHVFEHFFSHAGRPPFHWNGTYVEMGGADGVSISNTYFFESELGWSGLLVEPSSSYRKLVSRRSSRNTMLNEAVCSSPGNVTWVESDLARASTDVSGILSTLSTYNLKRYHSHSHRTTIRCQPLSAMLRAASIESIDFFSLDTEGSELSVLESMNWSIPISVLLVELDATNRSKDESVRMLLRSRGYRQHGPRMGFRFYNEIWLGTTFRNRSSRAEVPAS